MQGLRPCPLGMVHWMLAALMGLVAARIPFLDTTSVWTGLAYALNVGWETQICPDRLGLSHPERGRCKEKTVTNARVEKVLTARYFRHMSREGEGNDFGKRDLK